MVAWNCGGTRSSLGYAGLSSRDAYADIDHGLHIYYRFRRSAIQKSLSATEDKTVKSKLLLALCILILFVGVSVIENCAMTLRPIEPADNVSAVYRLAGEFRTVFANLLWIKADRYHHEYIQHDPNWCNNTELLGLFKMITMLDPRFVQAYSTGAYVLMNGYHDNPKALAYLRQGIKANPRSRELNELAAIIFAWKMKSPERALPYAQRAVRFAENDFERGVAERTLHSIQRLINEEKSGAISK